MGNAIRSIPAGGGSGMTKLGEYSAEVADQVRGIKIDIDTSWFTDYDALIFVPDIRFYSGGNPTSDWIRIAADSMSGSEYSGGSWQSFGPDYSLYVWCDVIGQNSKYAYRWISQYPGNNAVTKGSIVNEYLYYYAEAAAKTIAGTITVYGVKYQ